MTKRAFTFSDTIHSLHAHGDGLWIGHQGGVTHFDTVHGTASKWTTADGLPGLPVGHVATDAERVAVATPNGVAWCDDAPALVSAGQRGESRDARRWERGLAHPDGAGAFVHGVAFVRGRLYATSGGGRLYRHGEAGFEIVELPLPQARLTRLLPLPTDLDRRRVLVLTNNSGVLLLATGADEEPSLYQWSEDEGLVSRYATGIVLAGDHVIVAVRGGVHVADATTLVEAPENCARWGRIAIDEVVTPGEGSRIAALCTHAGSLWIGTAAGLHRLPFAALEGAARGGAAAMRVDDTPVRHLASCAGELWTVQAGALGRWTAAAIRVVEPQIATEHVTPRARWFRMRAPRGVEAPPPPPVHHPRFAPDGRWRAETEPEFRRHLVLTASPDELACGGEGGRVALRRGGRWATETIARLRRPPEVHALAWDPENACFWAATRFGLYQRDARGRWHRDHVFPGRSVHALCVWGGAVAALGTAGLHVYVQGEWAEVPFPDMRPSLAVGAANESAFALWGRSGAWLWRAGAPHPEPIALGVGRATCMTWGEAGELWIGAERGLVCWQEGDTRSFAWNHERRDRVTALLAHAGQLVVGSDAGLWMAPVRGLRDAAQGAALESRGRRLGVLDGLPDAHVTAALAHDSRVWIGTLAGLVMLE